MSGLRNDSPIVVGVDGSTESLNAVAWAADVAATKRLSLRIVHACTMTPHEPSFALVAAADRASTAHPTLQVETVQRRGSAGDVLLSESEHASMLVIGQKGVGRRSDMAMGSVAVTCGRQASVPVAIVPSGRQSVEQRFNRVVVGIDGTRNCHAAVGYAFAVASQRGSELVVVYADYQVSSQLVLDDVSRAAGVTDAVLADAVEDWAARYPDVRVVAERTPEYPAAALERHAERADLVVIGGRPGGLPGGLALGSMAGDIIRRVDKSVVVVRNGQPVVSPADDSRPRHRAVLAWQAD